MGLPSWYVVAGKGTGTSIDLFLGEKILHRHPIDNPSASPTFRNCDESETPVSVPVATLLSLLVPGTGLYYTGRTLREAASWYGGAFLATLVLNLIIPADNWQRFVLAGDAIIAIHVAAGIHTAIVARKYRSWACTARRLPALSVFLPGLGQLKAGIYVRGIAWLGGFAVLGYFLVRFGDVTAGNRLIWACLFTTAAAYALLSGYDIRRAVRGKQTKRPTETRPA